MRATTGRARSIAVVPRPALLTLVVALALQIIWHGLRPEPQARAEDLPLLPPLNSLKAASLNDPIVMAKLLTLWLQAFDNQPGVSIPFRDLNYPKVTEWLSRILILDPRGQYPLLAASRVYAEVPTEAKQRHMLEWVYEQFLVDPNRRWPWLAHASIIAKHRLEDLPLALKYARAITAHATAANVPYWARDMTIIILEDMEELDSARLLIGGLLDSGTISDAHERQFLERKLEELERRGDEMSSGS